MDIPAQRPPVVFWYKVYCSLLTLTYLGLAALGVGLVIGRHALADAETSPGGLLVMGVLWGGLGLVLAVPCAAALFLPPEPWTWVYHLVIICVGMTSACCLPVCVPLLIFWIKPETKAYFGRPA